MNKAAYRIVIPARLASTRLPNKVLLDIGGKPMLQHVFECAQRTAAKQVWIATDSPEVQQQGLQFTDHVLMTSAAHASGTDRIAEVAIQQNWAADDIVVNLQADEPLMPPACLDQLAELLSSSSQAPVATLYWPLEQLQQWRDPNVVKLVCADNGLALYFSRAAIPYPRHDIEHTGVPANARRHLGVYAYRVATLRQFSSFAESSLEQCEKLEQLRLLQAGYAIITAQAVQAIPPGIDTQEDLERVRQHFK